MQGPIYDTQWKDKKKGVAKCCFHHFNVFHMGRTDL